MAIASTLKSNSALGGEGGSGGSDGQGIGGGVSDFGVFGDLASYRPQPRLDQLQQFRAVRTPNQTGEGRLR
jgi:hypothetical protein